MSEGNSNSPCLGPFRSHWPRAGIYLAAFGRTQLPLSVADSSAWPRLGTTTEMKKQPPAAQKAQA
jgi:hypothetical protein